MSIRYSKPAAILFDWDNTLADTWPIIHQAMIDTFVHMGREPWTLEETKTNVHRSLKDAFPPMFGDRWQEARDVYFKSFLANHLEKIAVLEQAEELLECLVKAGVPIGVVSNKTGAYLREEVTHLGWDHYFGAIVGAGDAKEDKPSALPAYMALEKMGLAPGPDIWFIGDSVTDLDCAFNGGFTPVFYGDRDIPATYTADHPERAKDLPTIHHARNHGGLITFLKGAGL